MPDPREPFRRERRARAERAALLANAVVAEAQRLRGFIEDWKARDRDEAEAILDFIDAVDAYNLRNGFLDRGPDATDFRPRRIASKGRSIDR